MRVCFTPDKHLRHRYIKLARLVRAFGVVPMNESRSNEDLDVRRRRLRFRAWHRGIREMDLLMGAFADATIATLDDADLRCFEGVLDRGRDLAATGGANIAMKAGSGERRHVFGRQDVDVKIDDHGPAN